ncbi:MAG: P-II family nitrogen regulator [Acholeplasmataceae bacterium]|nr:P-II family nitrogen regulator [Acholeplasmataceae bacterium]
MSDIKLILTICNDGFAEEIMEEAKLAGARGGTIMRGRSSAIHEETKFFGITIHPEKDILMIVTKDEDCSAIMKAISNKHGVGTAAHALCFSMPIDETIGFNF